MTMILHWYDAVIPPSMLTAKSNAFHVRDPVNKTRITLPSATDSVVPSDILVSSHITVVHAPAWRALASATSLRSTAIDGGASMPNATTFVPGQITFTTTRPAGVSIQISSSILRFKTSIP
jgi:hypothetical protein